MPESFDVAILGGGSGGYVAAIRASQLGLKVALIEQDKVGGTCLHRGCIPTKALLQSAFLLDQMAHAAEIGVTAAPASLDYPKVASYRNSVVETLHQGVRGLLKKNGVTTFSGHGVLRGPTSIAVTEGQAQGTEVTANAVIIATGSRPKLVGGLVPDGQRLMTSDDALTFDHVPQSAIVLGAGAVGVEFASFYRSAGAEVTLVEMAPRLVPLEDADMGDVLRKQFTKRGITCLVGAQMDLSSIRINQDSVSVNATVDGSAQTLSAEVLLVAVGRTANTESIGLEQVGIGLERGFIPVNGWQQTAAPGVYALGDVVGGFQLAHKAMHEGIVAAEAIAGRAPHPLDPRLVTRTTYCTPQIASVGLSEQEAREAGHDVRVGKFPLVGNARALIWGEPSGLCKIVATSDHTVLGVHLVGHEVTELIYGPGLGMLLEATPFEMAHAVAPHPTLSEVVGEAALAVSGEAIHI